MAHGRGPADWTHTASSRPRTPLDLHGGGHGLPPLGGTPGMEPGAAEKQSHPVDGGKAPSPLLPCLKSSDGGPSPGAERSPHGVQAVWAGQEGAWPDLWDHSPLCALRLVRGPQNCFIPL